jgi:hypothetical protein
MYVVGNKGTVDMSPKETRADTVTVVTHQPKNQNRRRFMKWLCGCDKEVTRLGVLWEWRDAKALGQKHGRFVSYQCRMGCSECVPEEADERGRLQYFPLRLNSATKSALVNQVVAQILNTGSRGFLPKTDIQGALRSVHKLTD